MLDHTARWARRKPPSSQVHSTCRCTCCRDEGASICRRAGQNRRRGGQTGGVTARPRVAHFSHREITGAMSRSSQRDKVSPRTRRRQSRARQQRAKGGPGKVDEDDLDGEWTAARSEKVRCPPRACGWTGCKVNQVGVARAHRAARAPPQATEQHCARPRARWTRAVARWWHLREAFERRAGGRRARRGRAAAAEVARGAPSPHRRAPGRSRAATSAVAGWPSEAPCGEGVRRPRAPPAAAAPAGFGSIFVK
jgi:hypothetical protein